MTTCAKGAFWLVERRGEALIPTQYVDLARVPVEETTNSKGAEMPKKTNGSARGGGDAAKVAGLTSAVLGAGSLVAAGTALALSRTGSHDIVRRVRHLVPRGGDALQRAAAYVPAVDNLLGGNDATPPHASASEKGNNKKGEAKGKHTGKKKGKTKA